METEIAEVFMNPVRQRIIQYLLVHEKGTVKEIKKELPDVPSASFPFPAASVAAPSDKSAFPCANVFVGLIVQFSSDMPSGIVIPFV